MLPGKLRGDTREEQHSCPNLKIIQGDTDRSLPRTSFRITPLCTTSHSHMMNPVIQIAGTFDVLCSQSSEACDLLTAAPRLSAQQESPELCFDAQSMKAVRMRGREDLFNG